MTKLVLITILMLTLTSCSRAGWFFNTDNELKQQLQHEQQKNRELLYVSFALGIGCIGSFLAGTMIGSKTRRESNEK